MSTGGRRFSRSDLFEAVNSKDVLGDGCVTKFNKSGREVPHLSDAAANGDLDGFAMSIMAELGVRSQAELLPLIRGVLANVNGAVPTDHGSEPPVPAPEPVKKRSGAFSRGLSNSGDGDCDARDDSEGRTNVVTEEEAWRRMRRAVFSDDAALVLQQRALDGLRSDAFKKQLDELSSEWSSSSNPPSPDEQAKLREELCMERVLAPLMLQFGFEPGLAGVQEMEVAISACAENNEAVDERAGALDELLSAIVSGEGPGD